MALKDLDLLAYNAEGDMVVKFETNNGKIHGTKNLIQRVIKRIFTIQGSNSYNPEMGGQFDKLFTAITHEEADEFKETFGILLESIKEQLLTEQVSLYKKMDPSERLKDLVVQNMIYDPIFGGFLITIKVITANNSSVSVTLV